MDKEIEIPEMFKDLFGGNKPESSSETTYDVLKKMLEKIQSINPVKKNEDEVQG